MIDKSKEIIASVRLINDRLNFIGEVGENTPVSIDYIPPLGDNQGYTSLELFLLSLTSCLGSSVLTFLRRMEKSVTGCEIHALGLRKATHPTGFEKINITINIKSNNVTDSDMLKVVKLSEDTYCPVLSMLKEDIVVDINFDIDNS